MGKKMTKAEAEKLLGLDSDYTKSDLRAAYSKLIRSCHPDVAKASGMSEEQATEKTTLINEAHGTLKVLFHDGVEKIVPECKQSSSRAAGAEQAHKWQPHEETKAAYESRRQAEVPFEAASEPAWSQQPRSNAYYAASSAAAAYTAAKNHDGQATAEAGADFFTACMNSVRDNQTAKAAQANEAEKHSDLYRFLSKFPYRLALIVSVFVLYVLQFGILGANLSLSESNTDWMPLIFTCDASNVMERIFWVYVVGPVATANCVFGFITTPLRKMLLGIVKIAESNTKKVITR